MPESVVHQFCIRIGHRLGLAFEKFGGNLRKRIIREAGGTDGHTLLQEVKQHQFHNHIVDAKHPFARWQLGKLLGDLQAFHKIDICLVGKNQFAALHLIGGILQHVQVATESEILLVVGQEMQMDTGVALNQQRILDIVAVEGDGAIADRRRKGVLQQANLVVINIDICKDILRHRIQDIARLEEVIDTSRALAFYDVFLCMRRTAVDFLRYGFFDAGWQNEFTSLFTSLHLIDKPIIFTEFGRLQRFQFHIVECQRQLLILGVLIIVTSGEVGSLFMGYHLLHQFHSRIILA